MPALRMSAPMVTLTVRVPTELARRLERASARLDRSRGYLTREALERHLHRLERKR